MSLFYLIFTYKCHVFLILIQWSVIYRPIFFFFSIIISLPASYFQIFLPFLIPLHLPAACLVLSPTASLSPSFHAPLNTPFTSILASLHLSLPLSFLVPSPFPSFSQRPLTPHCPTDLFYFYHLYSRLLLTVLWDFR